MDLLSEILQTLRLRGTVYFHARFHAPWGMRIPDGEFANFHLVTRGKCWLALSNNEVVELKQGDMAIFPHGSTHTLLHERDANATPAKEVLSAPHSGEALCFGGAGDATTSLICGHFEYDKCGPHPLFETLDRFIHVTGSEMGNSEWAATATQLAATLSGQTQPGSAAVVDRLAEALFMHALTAHIATRGDKGGFLAAIQDRQIGIALNLIHRDIAREWTLTELASAASMSRSVFAQRFRLLVGASPMLYLSRYRMLKARELLLDTSLSLGRISEQVGYRSEFALSRAFKKTFGSPPAHLRRDHANN